MKIIDRNGKKYYHIDNEELRRFIWGVFDQETITSKYLYDTDAPKLGEMGTEYTAKQKLIDESSVFELTEATIDWIDECEHIQLVGTSRYLDSHNTILSTVVEEFVNVVTSEYSRLVTEATQLFETGSIDFTSLKVLSSVNGTHMSYLIDGVPCVGKIKNSSVETTWTGLTYLRIVFEMYNYGVTGLQECNHAMNIPYFSENEKLEKLGLCLLTNNIRQYCVDRGIKYVNLSSEPSYRAYVGTIVRRGYWQDTKFKSTGRIMVDYTAMHTIDPNYDSYFGHDGGNGLAVASIGRSDRHDKIGVTSYSDDILMCTSPFVYGFSFVSKQWGELLVDNIGDIKFREDAYDKLVLDSDIKNMLFSLVEDNKTSGTDFIDNKGGGTIFLLAGPPGTGKTLTAESIAEKQQKPLYMVGIGELGTTTEALEHNLSRILEVATTWGAVLLIDEADIFMEERESNHIERNAMVGIFLRMLEYYQGTLFLTSNRAKNIDSAFYSRISLAIKFQDLTQTSRIKIWENIINLYDPTPVNPDLLDELSKYDINGRQIKNIVRITYALCSKQNIKPMLVNFTKVIDHVLEFKI